MIRFLTFETTLIQFALIFSDRKPPGVGRGRGRGREDGAGGRPAKGIGRGMDDGGGRGGSGGRGKVGPGGKGAGNRGKDSDITLKSWIAHLYFTVVHDIP